MVVNLKRLGLIILTILAIGCKKSGSTRFELSGTIVGKAPKYIFIKYGSRKDSSLVVNNRFKFTGEVSAPIRTDVLMRPASTMNKFLYIENSKIEILLSITEKMHHDVMVKYITLDTIIGSKTALLQNEFEEYKAIHESDNDWGNKLYLKLGDIISSNPSHSYSGDLLAEVSKTYVLENDELSSLYNMLDLKNQSADSKESIKDIIYPERKLSVGAKMFDFTLSNVNGDSINTEKLKGSLLFIDFWASWCIPCRKQNPDLLKLYEKYKDKGFAILGVSKDTDKDRWLDAIRKDKISWENVIDMRGIESEVLVRYDATSAIPKNFLINKDGIIIKEDISITELGEFLQMNLN